MNDMNKRPPYQPLGAILRHLRERNRESVAEVSGAVEIDETVLGRIEDGSERPSEDILLLLISHFAIEDDKAAELWQLAGYDKAQNEDEPRERENSSPRQQTVMVMIDPRVMYSDATEVVANQKGVVINFSQVGGQQDSPLTIARIGMSHDQAKQVMGLLHQALYDLENPRPPRRLGDGSDNRNK